MDWGTIFSGVSAVGSIIAAVSGTVAALTSFAVYRFTRTSAATAVAGEDARRWTMDLATYATGECVAVINYDDGPRIRILSLEARAPRGLRLQRFHRETERTSMPGMRHSRAIRFVPEGPPQRLILDVFDTNPHTIAGATRELLLHLPSRPVWSRSATTRLRIRVRYEESIANRPQKMIELTSVAIPWIAPSMNGRSAEANAQE